MMTPLHVPSTLATRKGAGYLVEQAADRTVILTNHGKQAAVMMSPEHYDELVRTLREAADTLVVGVADLVAERSTFRTVDEARARLHAHG